MIIEAYSRLEHCLSYIAEMCVHIAGEVFHCR